MFRKTGSDAFHPLKIMLEILHPGEEGESAREWPRYCRKVCWTKMVQNGPNDHFGQNDIIPNWILAFARPKWTKMVHFGPFWPEEVRFGPFRSANLGKKLAPRE